MIAMLLTRWRTGLGIAGALAFIALALAANHYRHAYHAEKALRKANEAAFSSAVDAHIAAARRALEAQEAKYAAHAKDTDHAYQAKLADARAAAADYVRRMRAQAPARDGSGTLAAAEDRTAGVLQDVPASTGVVVSEHDVQACTEAYVYAVSAREWAMGLAVSGGDMPKQ